MTEAPTYRRDLLTGAWVVVAPGRAANVQGSGPDPLGGLPSPPGPCPFCPGNEAEAEPTVQAWPSRGPWRVRAVGNRFPAARPDGVAPPPDAPAPHAAPAFGFHEVIVEAPEHDLDLVDLGAPRLAEVLGAYRDRARVLESDARVRQVSLFRNRGRRAGSSQPHPHAQITGLAVLGPEQERRWARAHAHLAETGENLFAAALAAERRTGDRVIFESEGLVALLPGAPQRNYETWVLPSDPRGSFVDCQADAIDALARVVARVLPAVLGASRRTAYNLVFRLPPARTGADPAAGWLLEIAPRGAGPAGFELTSGLALLTVAPEAAAERVRALLAGPGAGR